MNRALYNARFDRCDYKGPYRAPPLFRDGYAFRGLEPEGSSIELSLDLCKAGFGVRRKFFYFAPGED